jgi:hypothetical protein
MLDPSYQVHVVGASLNVVVISLSREDWLVTRLALTENRYFAATIIDEFSSLRLFTNPLPT